VFFLRVRWCRRHSARCANRSKATISEVRCDLQPIAIHVFITTCKPKDSSSQKFDIRIPGLACVAEAFSEINTIVPSRTISGRSLCMPSKYVSLSSKFGTILKYDAEFLPTGGIDIPSKRGRCRNPCVARLQIKRLDEIGSWLLPEALSVSFRFPCIFAILAKEKELIL